MTRTADQKTSTTSKSKSTSTSPAKAQVVEDPSRPRRKESHRETVESIVVAFILALLIRGFEAEAFVIPTGSMAPTLMGRHKEIHCPQCGYTFAVNAADEDRGSDRIKAGTCVNCRFRSRVDDAPSFNGDRILVMKFPYDLPWLPGAGGPDRWDIVVFHYPENPEQNYIKRLVGRPNEELMILGGNLYARPLESGETFQILRKPLRQQRAMEMLVYNDAHRPEALKDFPDWRRWSPDREETWREDPAQPGIFSPSTSAGSDWVWLRYRHLVPKTWDVPRDLKAQTPRPSLITDFYSYNTNQWKFENSFSIEPHWVGDLTLHCQVDVEAARGQFVVELVKGGIPHRCTIDLASGEATLSRNHLPLGDPQLTPLTGPGTYQISFANVDDRLTLWVNGRTPFGDGIEYEGGDAGPVVPTEADLAPVGIGASGASISLTGLVLNRDIYYTSEPNRLEYDNLRLDEVEELLTNPERFSALASLREPQIFPIQPGRFMMMGDNSPRSRDSRAWDQTDSRGGFIDLDNGSRYFTDAWSDLNRGAHEVPEELLIGKAFFVYWPHGKPFGPDVRLSPNFRLPFRPYFERMRWIQ